MLSLEGGVVLRVCMRARMQAGQACEWESSEAIECLFFNARSKYILDNRLLAQTHTHTSCMQYT